MSSVRLGKGIAALSAIAASFCLLALATGCGGGDSSNALVGDVPRSAPKVRVPEGLPPTKLIVKDIQEGAGREAKKGDAVSLQYTCIVWENGEEYANSWRYAKVPTFVLGKHRLLRGLNFAVPGMREGGGREVLIPSTYIYYPEVRHPPLGRLGALICKAYLVNVLN